MDGNAASISVSLEGDVGTALDCHSKNFLKENLEATRRQSSSCTLGEKSSDETISRASRKWSCWNE